VAYYLHLTVVHRHLAMVEIDSLTRTRNRGGRKISSFGNFRSVRFGRNVFVVEGEGPMKSRINRRILRGSVSVTALMAALLAPTLASAAATVLSAVPSD